MTPSGTQEEYLGEDDKTSATEVLLGFKALKAGKTTGCDEY